MKDENIWNVPNILTMLRIAFIGVLIYFFVTDRIYYALGTFLLAGLTDLLDGYIARKKNLITTFGKLMDPLADKLMLIAMLACLTAVGRVSIWVVLIVAAKELVMMIGSYAMFKRGIVVYAHMIGKVATVVFLIAVIACFFSEYIAPYHQVLMVVAVLLSMAAFFWYLNQALKKVHEQARHLQENHIKDIKETDR